MTTIDRQIPTEARGALDDVLRAKIGAHYDGMSAGKYGVIIHWKDGATEAEKNTALQTVLTHDTSLRTPDQIARAARQTALESARKDTANVTPQSLKKASQDDLIKIVHWLMLEVNQLKERLGE